MFKKVIYLIASLFIMEIGLNSCCDCDVELNFDEVDYYEFEEMSVFNLDNSDQKPIITNYDSVNLEAFGLRVSFGINKLACNDKGGFSLFINKTHACSCQEAPLIAFEDSITSIKITTINNFSVDKPSGSDVTEFFKLLDNRNDNYTGFLSIEEFIEHKHLFLPLIVRENNNQDLLNLDFLLLNNPEIKGDNHFEVEITFSDGSIIIEESPKIYFQ